MDEQPREPYFADGRSVCKIASTGVAELYTVALSPAIAQDLAKQLNTFAAMVELVTRYDAVFPTPEAKALLMRIERQGGAL